MKKSNNSREQMLRDLIRSNKVRREKLAIKNGFKDSLEYINWLKGVKTPKKSSIIKTGLKPKIHNIYLLDESGSISGDKLTNAVNGINKEIENLQKETTIDYIQTVVRFEGFTVKTPLFNVPIHQSHVITPNHKGGYTPLYQAIGETLEKLVTLNELNPETKILVKIFTDGNENSSQGKYKDVKVISNFIKDCQHSLGFTITFVGTQIDVDYTINRLNIDESNTLVHDNTKEGVKEAFEKSYKSTVEYSNKVVKGEDVLVGFYKSNNVL